MAHTNPSWRLEQISPFGAIVRTQIPGANLSVMTTQVLKKLIEEHRIVVLRDFARLKEDAFPGFSRQFGTLLEWEFGAVNELRVHDEARNYLYTNHSVPFHWDGAFLDRAPHYIVFHCDVAPPAGTGGETLFCDTTMLLNNVSAERQKLWERIEITYTTEKVVHYGGTFTAAMLGSHPDTGERVLRYAEPVDDLNPVRLAISGISHEGQSDFITDMKSRLNDKNWCYAHQWRDGDVVIADNFSLLHGRRAFKEGTTRRIRRVNVL